MHRASVFDRKGNGDFMKSSTILMKIKKENACSVNTAELLTKALHREGLLKKDRAVRFGVLYGKFDIVNADFFETGEFESALCNGDWLDIDELIEYLKPKKLTYIVTENRNGWYDIKEKNHEGIISITKNQFESYIREVEGICKKVDTKVDVSWKFNFR